MPDYNARAYDLLSVGTFISKDNLNLVCLLARWGQPWILTTAKAKNLNRVSSKAEKVLSTKNC